MQLKFAPGINREGTRYTANPQWFDASLVRFRDGMPEMWSGWVRTFDGLEMYGRCRSLHRFSSLNGRRWVGIGTSKKFYAVSDDAVYDITPLRAEVTLGTNPIATTDGSNVVVISHTAHGAFPGDVVIISGATATGGIGTGQLNAEHIISGYIDDDSYEITVTSNATSTTTGGGSSVDADYLFHAGSNDQINSGGWGAYGWGVEVWGGDPSLGSGGRLGVWSQDNWGEDLVACPAGGPIFYWDVTTPSGRMVDILDLASADGYAPSQAEFIAISHRDRHLLAFGGTGWNSSTVEPMTVRWCSQENILDWDESATDNTAGSLPLSRGSKFIARVATQQEIIAWTDQAMYSLRYVGAPYIYGADVIADFSDIVGLNAAAVHNSSVFWFGRSGFYAYSGRVEKMKCDVWDYVRNNINMEQGEKVFASTNRQYNEIIWFYPSVGGDGECDSYVTYDTVQGAWNIGQLPRTAWMDMDALNNPLAASVDDFMYTHDFGAEDGSQSPAVALNAYIESGPIELSSEGSFDKGDKFMFIRRILPDITFRDYSDGVNTPKVDFTLKMMDKPGGGFTSEGSGTTARTLQATVEEFTTELHVRLRGRSMSLRLDNPTKGSKWRMGTPRIDVRTDGQR